MNNNSLDAELCSEILIVIKQLKYYFIKFNKSRYEEAMQRTLYHALEHYNEMSGELTPYIKSLARDILKEYDKCLPYENIELYVNDTETVDDIADTAISNSFETVIDKQEVINIALAYTGYFLTLCESILKQDVKAIYFPKEFKADCLRVVGKNGSQFNNTCIELYREYGDEMRKFLNIASTFSDKWVEADYARIDECVSKRVRLIGDLDKGDNLRIVGKLSGKRVIRVQYRDVLDYMCDLIDEDERSNMMRFNIGDSYIVRTLGGSLSIVNPSLFNMYELCKTEILTNILYDTGGRLLGTGYDYFYLLVRKEVKIPERTFGNITIFFEVEEVEL